MKIISKLVEEHGLFCGKDADPSESAEAGFLMCDRTEAWVVEVSGRQWVAERVTSMKWLDLSVVRRRDFAVISPASFLFLVSLSLFLRSFFISVFHAFLDVFRFCCWLVLVAELRSSVGPVLKGI